MDFSIVNFRDNSQLISGFKETPEECVKRAHDSLYEEMKIIKTLKKSFGDPHPLIPFLQLYKNTYNEFPLSLQSDRKEWLLDLPYDANLQLINKYPLLFMHLLDPLAKEDKIELFKMLVLKIGEWPSHFSKGFELLVQTEDSYPIIPQEHPAGEFILLLLSSLTPDNEEAFLKHCSYELNPREWIFFLLTLEEGELNRIFQLEWDVEAIIDDMKELATIHIDAQCKINLAIKILKRFFAANESEEGFYNRKKLLDNIGGETISLEIQIFFLEAFEDAERFELFHNYRFVPEILIGWADVLFRRQYDFEFRVNIFKLICFTLESDRLEAFVEQIIHQKSFIGPYLLLCLPQSLFKEFVLKINPKMHSMLLSNSVEDVSISKLLIALSESENWQVIFEEISLSLFSNLGEEEINFTLYYCFNTLESLSLDQEFILHHLEFIHSIPPFVIGLLATKKEYRQVLFSLALSFDEKQFCYLIVTLSDNSLSDALDELSQKVRQDQLGILFSTISEWQRHEYIKEKIHFLDSSLLQFQVKYKNLLAQLKSIQGDSLLSQDECSLLESETFQLRALYMHSQHPTCKMIHNFYLQPYFDGDQLNTFRLVQNRLSNKSSLVRGDNELSIELERVQKLSSAIKTVEINNEQDMEWIQGKSIDLINDLSQWFWALFKERDMPHLEINKYFSFGMSNLSHLYVVGIHSNRDLEKMNVTLECVSQLESLIQKIKHSFIKNQDGQSLEKKQDEFYCLWHEFVRIDLEPEATYGILKNVLNILNTNFRSIEQIKKQSEFMYNILCESKILSNPEMEEIKNKMKEMETATTNVAAYLVMECILRDEMLLLRKHHPLVRFQAYLKGNEGETWQLLRSKGIQCIENLFAKQWIHSSSELFDLKSALAL